MSKPYGKGAAVADLNLLDDIDRFAQRLVMLHCALLGADIDPYHRQSLELYAGDLVVHFDEIRIALNSTRELAEPGDG